MQGSINSGRRPAEVDEKSTDEPSHMKRDRPLSPTLDDYVFVPDNSSFDSLGTDCPLFEIFCVLYFGSVKK